MGEATKETTAKVYACCKRCGEAAAMVSSPLYPDTSRPSHSVFCEECGHSTRYYWDADAAYIEWNEMNEDPAEESAGEPRLKRPWARVKEYAAKKIEKWPAKPGPLFYGIAAVAALFLAAEYTALLFQGQAAEISEAALEYLPGLIFIISVFSIMAFSLWAMAFLGIRSTMRVLLQKGEPWSMKLFEEPGYGLIILLQTFLPGSVLALLIAGIGFPQQVSMAAVLIVWQVINIMALILNRKCLHLPGKQLK